MDVPRASVPSHPSSCTLQCLTPSRPKLSNDQTSFLADVSLMGMCINDSSIEGSLPQIVNSKTSMTGTVKQSLKNVAAENQDLEVQKGKEKAA